MLNRLCVSLILAVSTTLSGPAIAQVTASDTFNVHMVVWRGCEDACQSFIRYFEDRELPVEVEVTDVSRDRDKLPMVQAQLLADPPDLVVTWGTSVSRGILGTREDHGTGSALGEIPAIFMIVADPVGSDLVASYDASGRDMVSGVRNRVPEDVQLRLLFEYFRPEKLGVLNHPGELNSILNTDKLRAISGELDFELVEQLYQLDADGDVEVGQIQEAMAALKAKGAQAVYVGSSSYNLEHQTEFVAAATALELPVFSAYTQMVRDGGALMAVGTSYSNVGRLAAGQVADVLLNGKSPGDLSIKELNRYSVILNMASAEILGLYPPLSLISVAEVVK